MINSFRWNTLCFSSVFINFDMTWSMVQTPFLMRVTFVVRVSFQFFIDTSFSWWRIWTQVNDESVIRWSEVISEWKSLGFGVSKGLRKGGSNKCEIYSLVIHCQRKAYVPKTFILVLGRIWQDLLYVEDINFFLRLRCATEFSKGL